MLDFLGERADRAEPATDGDIMKRLSLVLLLFFAPVVSRGAVEGCNVSAPAIKCVFNPPCTLTVNDTSDNVVMSNRRHGLFAVATFHGFPGAPATAVRLRISPHLRNAVGATAISCVDWISMSFGR